MRRKSLLAALVSIFAAVNGAIAFAEDADSPAAAVDPLDALDARTIAPKERKALPRRTVAMIAGDPREVSALAFTPDGRTLITAHQGGSNKGDPGGTIRLWDVTQAAPNKIARLDGHADWIASLAVSPNGKVLVSGGARFDKSVRLWDLSFGSFTKARGKES